MTSKSDEKKTSELELFHLPHCPYSRKVREFIEDQGLEPLIRYRNVEDPENFYELQRLTGEQQVPCLVIDGKPMLESEQIIHWLKMHPLQEAA